jgi:hypothetical protein
MPRFAETINALKKGAEKMTVNAAVKNIEGWEDALRDLDEPGAKQILQDLGSLKEKLQEEKPKGPAIQKLLQKLGKATTKIAAKDEKNAEKLEEIGELLSADMDDDKDESEDEDESAGKGARKKAKA